MSALLDKAGKELDAAKERLEGYFPEGLIGYAMSQSLCVDDVLWARSAAKALEAWALAHEQYREAKRVATWNPETGWASPGKAVSR